jgi:hypothetical protein
MIAHQLCPEVSNATSDVIDVLVEVGYGLECRQLVGRISRKAGEIHLHPTWERAHQPSDPFPISDTERAIESEAIRQALEERPLGQVSLVRKQSRLNRSNFPPINLIVKELFFEPLQEVEPTRTLDQIRVGNRVGGPGKEIGQTRLSTDRSGQDIEGEIERP